ncbi:hypothetical protein BKA65DRAFT_119938 [Rhexocercosporidium sp. MPI-PUGE-AT-0058]|nr:hypothetical protein BKA65DRAFT_119938 [Rhexocercosporidium sp. MPI-PUGE-AT-0058]
MMSVVRPIKKLVIYCDSAVSTTPRAWRVKLGIEDPDTKEIKYIKDKDSDEDAHFDLVDPWDKPRYDQEMTPEWTGAKFRKQENSEVPKKLQDYGKSLYDRLGLQEVLNGCGCDRISIHEDIHPTQSSNEQTPPLRRASIHSLLWEVFEHPKIWSEKCAAKSEDLPPRITRVLTRQLIDDTLVRNRTCRILLVISRSFQYMVIDSMVKPADAKPGLIQSTLLEIGNYLEKKGLGSRFTLDVVRPGTFVQFENFLNGETNAGRKYDIVHFDLHGSISKESSLLRFGTSNHNLPHLSVEDDTKFVVPDAAGYQDINVHKVAKELQDHGVTRVALNACLSSCAQNQTLPSMAEIFIEHGVTSVSAMSYMISDETAKIYYDAFYQALILGEKGFHEAAAKGREALRLESPGPKDWLNPTNYRNRVITFNNKLLPGRPHIIRWIWLAGLLGYLHACPWPDTSYRFMIPSKFLSPIHSWPVTSPNNGWSLRLKTLESWLVLATLFSCLIVYRHQVPSRALALQRYLVDRAAQKFSRADHYAAYSAFHKERIIVRKRERRASNLELSIEHMAIEDHLHWKKRLYLWGDDNEYLNTTIVNLARLWIRTGFIDEAYIKDATDFLGFLSLPHLTKSIFNGGVLPDRHRKVRGPRALLVIQNIDKFVVSLKNRQVELAKKLQQGKNVGSTKKAQLVKNFELANADETQRMNSWIKSHSAGSDCLNTYLVITGDKDNNWWKSLVWGPDINPSWGDAFPYNPNIFEWGSSEADLIRPPPDPYT